MHHSRRSTPARVRSRPLVRLHCRRLAVFGILLPENRRGRARRTRAWSATSHSAFGHAAFARFSIIQAFATIHFQPARQRSGVRVAGEGLRRARQSARLSANRADVGRDSLRPPLSGVASSDWAAAVTQFSSTRPYNHEALALPPGTRLGPYVITSPLGAGGMGEVDKATGTRLNRTLPS